MYVRQVYARGDMPRIIVRSLLSITVPFYSVVGININDDIGPGNWRYVVVEQTKWNKQNCGGRVGTYPCAVFVAFSDVSYYFMCLRSAMRVNNFEG